MLKNAFIDQENLELMYETSDGVNILSELLNPSEVSYGLVFAVLAVLFRLCAFEQISVVIAEQTGYKLMQICSMYATDTEMLASVFELWGRIAFNKENLICNFF